MVASFLVSTLLWKKKYILVISSSVSRVKARFSQRVSSQQINFFFFASSRVGFFFPSAVSHPCVPSLLYRPKVMVFFPPPCSNNDHNAAKNIIKDSQLSTLDGETNTQSFIILLRKKNNKKKQVDNFFFNVVS